MGLSMLINSAFRTGSWALKISAPLLIIIYRILPISETLGIPNLITKKGCIRRIKRAEFKYTKVYIILQK